MGVDDPGGTCGGVACRGGAAADYHPEIWYGATRWGLASAAASPHPDPKPVRSLLVDREHHGAALVRVGSVAEPGASAVARTPEFHLFIAGRPGRSDVIIQGERPGVDDPKTRRGAIAAGQVRLGERPRAAHLSCERELNRCRGRPLSGPRGRLPFRLIQPRRTAAWRAVRGVLGCRWCGTVEFRASA